MSVKVYVDFMASVASKNTKYHGGGAFSRMMVQELLKYVQNVNSNYKITLIFPLGYIPQTDEERELFNNKAVSKKELNHIKELEVSDNSIILIPLIAYSALSALKIIKYNNPKSRLYVFLHGTRTFDLRKYDKYDSYYFNRIPIIPWFRYNVAAFIAKHNIKRYIGFADRIYTVSNNSLQSIVKTTHVKYIKFFYQKVSFDVELKKATTNTEKFILFVSANRPEKNLLRTLIAFCRYKQKTNDDIKLYIVGIDIKLLNNLLKAKEVDVSIVNKYIETFSYVSANELHNLYQNCKFLLYTSKSEGYGIPLIEAMKAGRPAVASYLTSIPEVLGCYAYYVNPYSVNSIEEGITFMANEKNSSHYTEMISKVKEVIEQRSIIDMQNIIWELLN